MGDHFAVLPARSTREHASHTPDEEAVRHSSTAPDTLLRLQSLVGNQATQRLVQKMGAHDTLQRDKTRPAKRDASLGLGFSNLRHITKGSPDVLGNTQADNGSLGDFRKAVADAPLGPKLSPEQSLALGKLMNFDPIVTSLKKQVVPADDLAAFKSAVEGIEAKGVTRVAICDFYGFDLAFLENTLKLKASGSSGSDKRSPLAAQIMDAMDASSYIRSNLVGFTQEQILHAKSTSPAFDDKTASAARGLIGEQHREVPNFDVELWRVGDRAAGWGKGMTYVSVWELAMLLNTPKYLSKTRFYNYTGGGKAGMNRLTDNELGRIGLHDPKAPKKSTDAKLSLVPMERIAQDDGDAPKGKGKKPSKESGCTIL